jgi:cell division transport system ATP-binding protein
MSDPLLLLADEPTGDLDAELAADVLRLLGEINTRGTTVVVATHDTSVVQDLGRRTILLKGGRIVEDRA